MAGINLRPATPSEHELIARLVNAAEPFGGTTAERWLALLTRPDFQVWLALDGDVPVGVAWWTDKPESFGGVRVHPDHRGRDVGRMLADHVDERIAGRPARCSMFSLDPRDARFARHRGFAVDEVDTDGLIAQLVLPLPGPISSAVPKGFALSALRRGDPGLWLLAQAFKAERSEDEGVPVESKAAFDSFCQTLHPASSLFLLDSTGRPVAFTLVEERGTVAYTVASYVEPAARRRGLGRALKTASLDASAGWATWAQTECRRANTPILELNKSLGMQEVHHLRASRG